MESIPWAVIEKKLIEEDTTTTTTTTTTTQQQRRHTGHDISSVDLKILAELKMEFIVKFMCITLHTVSAISSRSWRISTHLYL